VSYIAEGDGPDLRPGEEVQRIPPTVVVFYGRPTVFFLAICTTCAAGSAPKPQPFATEAHRDRWVTGHETTGHKIDIAVEVRP
jgi:hypothetical protein